MTFGAFVKNLYVTKYILLCTSDNKIMVSFLLMQMYIGETAIHKYLNISCFTTRLYIQVPFLLNTD